MREIQVLCRTPFISDTDQKEHLIDCPVCLDVIERVRIYSMYSVDLSDKANYMQRNRLVSEEL